MSATPPAHPAAAKKRRGATPPVPLILSDEQKLLQSTVDDFVRENADLARLRRYRDDRALPGYDPALWRQFAELGLLGVQIPETYGGSGLGFMDLCLVMQAAGSRLLPEPVFSTLALGAQAILLGGSQAQQADVLPGISAGQRIVTLAHQEPAGRYDRFHVETAAHREGAGWLLSGEKAHVFDGHVADTVVVPARTSGRPGQARGITLFVIARDTPGLTITRLHQLDGRNTAHLALANVRVPDRDILGAVDAGGPVLDAVLDRATIAFAAEMLGATQAAFDIALDYLKTRIQFDVPIGSFQALQHRAARMFVSLSLARSAVLGAAGTVDRSPRRIAAMASLVKAKLSATMVQIANEGVQMHGGVGVTDEYDIGLFLKRARAADASFGDAAWHRERWARLQGY